jgi:hypothetical protein
MAVLGKQEEPGLNWFIPFVNNSYVNKNSITAECFFGIKNLVGLKL